MFDPHKSINLKKKTRFSTRRSQCDDSYREEKAKLLNDRVRSTHTRCRQSIEMIEKHGNGDESLKLLQ